MAAEDVFIDTNVLIYINQIRSPHHEVALLAVDSLYEAGSRLWISAKVCREYLAASTRIRTNDGASLMKAAIAEVRQFERSFLIAPEGPRTFSRLLDLLERVGHAAGKQVHDTHLVATMLEAGVERLLTFNTSDFRRFEPAIQIMDPFAA